MKLWLAVCLGLLAFWAGIVVGWFKEARRIERRKEYLRRIHNDYEDSIGG